MISKNAEAGPSRAVKIPTIPRRWEGTISAPIEEGDVEVFLSSFAAALDGHFIPTKRHFQLLLYLAITSPDASFPALDLLNQIINLYPASALTDLLPSISREKEGHPSWLKWEDESKSALDKAVRRWIRPAAKKGVWCLSWEEQGFGSRSRSRSPVKRRVDDDEEDEEEERLEQSLRRVSEKGWRVLDLLVRLWKKDQEEHLIQNPDQDWSPLFLSQLPHPYSHSSSLQNDDATYPLEIVRSFLAHTASDDDSAGQGVAGRRNQEIVQKLLDILISTAQYPSSPFHAPSLLLSLLALLRPLPLPSVQAFHTLLPPTSSFSAHLLVLELEDLAGVRVSKSTARRNPTILSQELNLDWTDDERDDEVPASQQAAKSSRAKQRSNFPPPTIAYLADLLLLPYDDTNPKRPSNIRDPTSRWSDQAQGDQIPQMQWLKQSLVIWLTAFLAGNTGGEWSFAVDLEWRVKFERNWSAEGGSEQKTSRSDSTGEGGVLPAVDGRINVSHEMRDELLRLLCEVAGAEQVQIS